MTDEQILSPRHKFIGVTLLCSLSVLSASVLAADNPLRPAAEDTASCLSLRNPDVRLACFDAAAQRLSEALGSQDQAQASAAEVPSTAAEPIAEDTPAIPDAPDMTVAAAATVAHESSDAASDPAPSWAAAPKPQPVEAEEAEAPRQFEATIVRITRNNVGRHRFYTADGAVWEQTQLVEVRQPKSLPAVAEIRKKLTGNPTIKFDVSSRSYRVRRIE